MKIVQQIISARPRLYCCLRLSSPWLHHRLQLAFKCVSIRLSLLNGVSIHWLLRLPILSIIASLVCRPCIILLSTFYGMCCFLIIFQLCMTFLASTIVGSIWLCSLPSSVLCFSNKIPDVCVRIIGPQYDAQAAGAAASAATAATVAKAQAHSFTLGGEDQYYN